MAVINSKKLNNAMSTRAFRDKLQVCDATRTKYFGVQITYHRREFYWLFEDFMDRVSK